MSPRARLAVVAIVASLGTGCGGKSDAERVTATVTSYFDALAAGDGGKACDQLTGEEARALARLAVEQVPEFGVTSCADAVTSLAKQLGGDEKATLRGVDVFDVAVHGSSATAFVKRAAPIELRRVSGTWLISGGISGG